MAATVGAAGAAGIMNPPADEVFAASVVDAIGGMEKLGTVLATPAGADGCGAAEPGSG